MSPGDDTKHYHYLACLSDRHREVYDAMEKGDAAEDRLDMCHECPSRADCRCSLSKLPILLTCSSKYEECPIGKWSAEVKLGDAVSATASWFGVKRGPQCGCASRHAKLNQYTPPFVSKALTWLSRLAGRDTR